MSGSDQREGGFVVLHRRIESWPLYQSLGAAQRHVITTVILAANWKASSFWYGPTQIHVNRGELAMAEQTIAKRAGTSRKVVRGVLSKLEAEGFISRKKVHPSGQCPTVITIKKYDEYQSITDEEGQPKGQRRARGGPERGPDRTKGTSGTSKPVVPEEAPAAPPLKDDLAALWQAKYGFKPGWTGPDFVQLAALSKRLPDGEVVRRFKNYLASEKPFFVGHPLRKFATNADEFLAAPVRAAGFATAESHESFAARGGGTQPW